MADDSSDDDSVVQSVTPTDGSGLNTIQSGVQSSTATNVQTVTPLAATSAQPGQPVQLAASITNTNVAAPVDLKGLKVQQTILRRSITLTCKRIRAMIMARGSRHGIQAHVKGVLESQTDLVALHNSIIVLLPMGDRFDKQHNKHITYVEDIAEIDAQYQDYLATRINDAPSIMAPSVGAPSVGAQSIARSRSPSGSVSLDDSSSEDGHTDDDDGQRAPGNVDPNIMAHAQQIVDHTRAVAQQAVDAADRAATALHNLSTTSVKGVGVRQRTSYATGGGPTRTSHRSNDLSQLFSPTMATSAPDDWIERYVRGVELPLSQRRSADQSSIKMKMETFSGNAVDWFRWIGLFHALVHRTHKDPVEKLAILQNHLTGDCAYLVHGLHSDENDYKEALLRLRRDVGRRDVMRSAILQALDKLQLVKNDPAGFKRYADRIRTHLFDLSKIGECGHGDIIDRITHRLHLTDRLAWNEGRIGELESRTMNQFGVWLCNRAAAYQNPHAIALAQAGGARPIQTSQSTRPFNQSGRQPPTRVHHSSTDTRAAASTASGTSKKSPFCFFCEKDHWIESCAGFKALPIQERNAFAR